MSGFGAVKVNEDLRNNAKLSPKDVAMLILQLCTAIEQMHTKKEWCHLDLKTENVFVTRTKEGAFEVRLGDLATVRAARESTPLCGTFIAPEMFKQTGSLPLAQTSMDLWSLGEILLQWKYNKSILAREGLMMPMPIETYLEQAKVVEQKAAAIIGPNPDLLDQLIIKLFSFDPQRRPSATEVRMAVEAFVATV